MQQIRNAFTLVELIIVITILAILGTIAFISLEDYSKSSRNSVRLTDIGMVKQSLGIYEVESGSYPLPGTFEEITYEGGLLFRQGTYDDQVNGILDNLSKKSIDPLFNVEYDYSVINNRTKYQLGTVIEGGIFGSNNLLKLDEAMAYDYADIRSYVTGNYDLFDLNSVTASGCKLVTIPSLFVNNHSATGALELGKDHYFVFDASNNISLNYGRKIDSTLTPTPFLIKQTLNSCNLDTIDELNIYILNSSVAFQQLIESEDFNEIIYNYSVPTFKVGMIDNLNVNGISVNGDLYRQVMNPSAWNIYYDTFTKSDGVNIFGAYVTDTLGTWSRVGSLVDTSYVVDGNSLIKNDANDGVILAEPTLPVISRDRSVLFTINDFASGDITVYSSYIDADNYFGVTLNETGYSVNYSVGGVIQGGYPLSGTFSYGVNPFVEFTMSGGNFKLVIDGLSPTGEIVAGAAVLSGKPGVKIGNNGGKIDNFNLVYK